MNRTSGDKIKVAVHSKTTDTVIHVHIWCSHDDFRVPLSPEYKTPLWWESEAGHY